MQTLGICVRYASSGKGRPVLTGVLAAGTRAGASVVEGFELKTSSDDAADQLEDLARALSSKLSGLTVQEMVVRVADFARVASRKAAVQNRLLIEGAIIFVARDKLGPIVTALDGKEIGLRLGTNKEGATALGRALDSKRPDAAMAALSGLPS